MTSTTNEESTRARVAGILDLMIRLGAVLLLVYWCFWILAPFIELAIWGGVIAIAVYPLFKPFEQKFGQRRRLATLLFTLCVLIVVLTPTILLGSAFLENAGGFVTMLREGRLVIPPPPESVASWPVIGEPVSRSWLLASENLGQLLSQLQPQLRDLGRRLLSAGAGTGLAILQIGLSCIIAGLFLARAERSVETAGRVMSRLFGARGQEFRELSAATVRSVAQGILGVAIVQALLAGIGMLVVGIPAAGLWAFVCLILCVIQLGVVPVLLPAVIYLFVTTGGVTAFLFAAWCVFVTLIDNVLKPVLLARGVHLPVSVIFLGSIGGFLQSGVIGLFVGAVVLSLGYELWLAWLKVDPSETLVAEQKPSIPLDQ